LQALRADGRGSVPNGTIQKLIERLLPVIIQVIGLQTKTTFAWTSLILSSAVHPKQKVKILSLSLSLSLCKRCVKCTHLQFLSAPLFLLAFLLSYNAEIFQPIENDEEDGNLSDRALDLRLLEGQEKCSK
jgi:hypothetical protein